MTPSDAPAPAPEAALDRVRSLLLQLQTDVIDAIDNVERAAGSSVAVVREHHDLGERGESRPAVLTGGLQIEKAAVNFSASHGQALPPAATARRPELAGQPFTALATSLIIHPRNPWAPTTHLNLRYFSTRPASGPPTWWFGGGFDLTPSYGFVEDCRLWHEAARAAAGDDDTYAELKDWCDRYFTLPHRGETRGVGGLFFDDWIRGGWEQSFALAERVAQGFMPAYAQILARRLPMAYGERERDWQLHRRGRYVEFNLLQDRGTLYGLQSGRRVESVLASMPPLVAWTYQHTPPADGPEAALVPEFLRPRDWLQLGAPPQPDGAAATAQGS